MVLKDSMERIDCKLTTQDEDNKCNFRKIVVSWYHGQCQNRPYGGCNPSPNNFSSNEECEQIAAETCTNAMGLWEQLKIYFIQIKDSICNYLGICKIIGLARAERLDELSQEA
ncbi:unnamed protein product [Psylliodes chrysocephalus]|uniref:BPTI/Kunitz inhibitor domain-containing protein n=1 Tax=Psylliodes chrysocephalus TaxID=3402493 RepID=A0A9P0CCY2_9CUCU|nr:unnamed protein product [Psylliodes chrysocephala]